jgi:hypothetical protein
MDQLRDYADERLVHGCIYCGGQEATREHAPSKVFLDAPFPENLSVVFACRSCNNGFSPDEEYIACLIESVIAGTTDPEKIQRTSIAKILARSPALRARIEKAKYQIDGRTHFIEEENRVRNVLIKLAMGHAVFELSQICRDEPTSIWWSPLEQLTEDVYETFHSAHVTHLLGEVGSRGMQRQYVVQLPSQGEHGNSSALRLIATDWVDVQDQRYRYLAIHESEGVCIRIVIREYLACEVLWRQ